MKLGYVVRKPHRCWNVGNSGGSEIVRKRVKNTLNLKDAIWDMY